MSEPEELDFDDIEHGLAAEKEWAELVELGEAIEYVSPEWYERPDVKQESAVICDQCAALVEDNQVIRLAHEDFHRELYRHLAIQDQRVRRLTSVTSNLLEAVKLMKREIYP